MTRPFDDVIRRLRERSLRMGSLAEAILANAQPGTAFPPELRGLADATQSMLRQALDAFAQSDAGAARRVLDQDDRIDSAQDQIVASAVRGIPAQPEQASEAIDVIFVAKNLERVADHATNIAEDVILVAEARNVKHASKLR